jgi:6-phosphogluconate dehydrogenase
MDKQVQEKQVTNLILAQRHYIAALTYDCAGAKGTFHTE